MTGRPDEDARQDVVAAEIEKLATAILKARMRKAAQDYSDASTSSELREAVASVLAAVDLLMMSTDMVPYLGPVRAAVFALSALDEGVVLPLLEGNPRPPNAPKIPMVVWAQRAVVAAALEQRFRRTGGQLPAAAAEVARWLEGSELFRTIKNPTSAIIKWRERMMEQASNDQPTKQYEVFTLRGESGYVRPLPNAVALLGELKIWGVRRNPSKPPH